MLFTEQAFVRSYLASSTQDSTEAVHYLSVTIKTISMEMLQD